MKTQQILEQCKFVQVKHLQERWGCSRSLIYDMLQCGCLEAWHPYKRPGKKGIRISLESILRAERKGCPKIPTDNVTETREQDVTPGPPEVSRIGPKKVK